MITDNETVCEHNSQRDIEVISRQIQQGVWDCISNPLVPKAFQMPVESHSLVAAIESIAQLVRAPLEEKLQAQQEQISRLQETLRQISSSR